MVMMNIRKKPLQFWFTLISLLLFCLSTPTVKSHINGCSMHDIDIGLCLNLGNDSFTIDETCCNVLNKIAQIGYNCLCLILASSFPLLSTPFSFALPNCHVSVPPLSFCRVLAPMPVVFPPDSPDRLTQQPSLPPKEVLSPPTLHQLNSSLPPKEMLSTPTLCQVNATKESNFAEVTKQSPPENSVPRSSLSEQDNKSSNGGGRSFISLQVLFMAFSLHVCSLKA